MLSESILRYIAEIFIGDQEDYYQYKSGDALVNFFNDEFGFNDEYGSGFPSRWYYTSEKLKDLIERDDINDFFTKILSTRFIQIENRITEVEAVELSEQILNDFNRELKLEDHKINKLDSKYILVDINSDLKYIGEGGFAVVFKQISTGIIIKKLKEEFLTNHGIRSRFKREFKITKSLSDVEGVIDIYDFNNDEFSYTMEEADITLYDYIVNNDIDNEEKEDIINKILNIIKEVHNKEIVHRDINPNNILIINDDINISDFGLGKDLDVFHSHITVDTHSYGQYPYCAPEQFMKLKDGNKKSDVYSLGSLINFIFTKDPSNKRHRLRSVVEKARNENPNIRFENAELLLESVKQTIKYHKDKRREEKVKIKIEENKLDEDVENYIYELSGQRLCNEIISQSNFKNIIIEFMTINKTNSAEIMKLIENNFIDSCSRYEHHDNFSSIAKNIIKAQFPFVSKEIAAKILNYNANDVNRFHAQRIIEDLTDEGVEPLIEDILEG